MNNLRPLLLCLCGVFAVVMLSATVGDVRKTVMTDNSGNVVSTPITFSNLPNLTAVATTAQQAVNYTTLTNATSAGLTNVYGTASQLTATKSGSTVTMSLPSAITVNNITSTGTISCVTLIATTFTNTTGVITNLTLAGTGNAGGNTLTNLGNGAVASAAVNLSQLQGATNGIVMPVGMAYLASNQTYTLTNQYGTAWRRVSIPSEYGGSQAGMMSITCTNILGSADLYNATNQPLVIVGDGVSQYFGIGLWNTNSYYGPRGFVIALDKYGGLSICDTLNSSKMSIGYGGSISLSPGYGGIALNSIADTTFNNYGITNIATAYVAHARVSSTLQVTGASTLNGALTATNTAMFKGATTVSNTLNVTGGLTLGCGTTNTPMLKFCTNSPTLTTVAQPGSIEFDGTNFWATGNQYRRSILRSAYGGMYIYNGVLTNTITTNGLWYPFTGFTIGHTNVAVETTSSNLVCRAAAGGMFMFNICATMSGNGANTVQIAGFKNGVIQSNMIFGTKFANSGDLVSGAFCGFVSGTNGDYFDIRGTSDGNGDIIYLKHCNVTAHRVGVWVAP
jgi:hypothetical protein